MSRTRAKREPKFGKKKIISTAMAVNYSSSEHGRTLKEHPETMFQNDSAKNMEKLVHVFYEFPPLLMAKLNEQRNSACMCDVTIITKDRKSFRAHRAVLAASSRFLERELSLLHEEKSEAVIHLGMISSETFITLLNLMYTSKLSLMKDNAADVLLAAEILGLELEQVTALCRQFLRSHITSKSVARGTESDESVSNVLRDENNNHDISFYKGTTNSYKRGQSEESSSGVSSCSSLANFTKDGEAEDMTVFCPSSSYADEKQSVVPKHRPVSLSETPSSTPKEIEVSRPASAPTYTEDISKSNDSEDEIIVDDLPQDTNNVDLFEIATPSSVFSYDQKNCVNSTNAEQSTQSSQYKIKSEVQLLPEYYPQFQNVTTNMASSANYDEKAKYFNDDAKHSHPSHSDVTNSSKSDARYCYSQSTQQQVPSTLFPFVASNRRSYENSLRSSSEYVDLNSLTVPSRKKAKNADHTLSSSYLNSPTLPIQGSYQDPSSFWASLYMLRSQALNRVNFFGANYGLPTSTAKSVGTGDEAQKITTLAGSPPLYPRRHLQHSKSMVTPNALLCRLCRLEFTSEWALSMHYNLCHPMSFCRSQNPSSLTSPNIDGTKNHGDQSSHTPFSTRQIPLMRSTSTPGKIDTQLHSENKESNAEMIGLSDYKSAVQTPAVHKCYHCKKEFDSIFLLRKHRSTEHMKRPFRCHRCESAFPNKAGLNVHLRSHTGERPYRCKVCNKAFTQLGHVQRHQKVHTGEKPYECPLCQARVRDKASMHYHILAHRGVKPFQCDQCDARFTKRSSLVKHKNVHTGSFLYQCPQCKASFREKASLSRHVRSQHKDPCFTVSSDFVNNSATTMETSQVLSLDLSAKPSTAVNLCMDNANEIRVA
uniref:uncharacterized protein LOC120333626 isoform X3 n=1 Tax=Styela clava TaxID=7725 RepID=UPI00193AD9A8|nr:uncharacterized protein LOC120333626 isoform X3 [Styela clava]